MIKNLIIVCNASKAKLMDSPCCAGRGSSALIKTFRDKIEAAGLTECYDVKAGGCMKNCQKGISVKIHPDQILYSNVTIEDLDAIIKQHLVEGKPLNRLKTERINRFLEF